MVTLLGLNALYWQRHEQFEEQGDIKDLSDKGC